MDHVLSVCRQRAEKYGLIFGERPWLSNSRLSLEAAEFAKDMGRYDAFHHAVFKAYFTEGLDIGNKTILLDVASRSGLESAALETALSDGTYSAQARQGSEEARRLGVTAVPSFFIEDQPVITGAVREETFREVLRSIAKG